MPNVNESPQVPVADKAAGKADTKTATLSPALDAAKAAQAIALARSGDPHDRQRGHASRLHLLDKAEVCAIANVTFPTIWLWMQRGKFPRSRVVGGKSMWLSTEVDAWLANLPVRPLKGDREGTRVDR
jgi:predicted DNA-binding transcriptional regulator AlpA